MGPLAKWNSTKSCLITREFLITTLVPAPIHLTIGSNLLQNKLRGGYQGHSCKSFLISSTNRTVGDSTLHLRMWRIYLPLMTGTTALKLISHKIQKAKMLRVAYLLWRTLLPPFASVGSQESLPPSPLHACTGPSSLPPVAAVGPATMPCRNTCNISSAHL